MPTESLITTPLYGLSPYFTPTRTYHGRTYPPSYGAALVRMVLAGLRVAPGQTADKTLAATLDVQQARFSALKNGRDLLPLDLATTLGRMTGASDDAIPAWVDADERNRKIWIVESRSIGSTAAAQTKRLRRLREAGVVAQATQAAQAAPTTPKTSIVVVQKPATKTPVVTVAQVEDPGRKVEAWIRETFGIAPQITLADATRRLRITAIDFEGLHKALVALLEDAP